MGGRGIPALRVLLFDPVTDGHHLEYATFVSRFLREQGDLVTFATLAPRKGWESAVSAFDRALEVGSGRVSESDSPLRRHSKVVSGLREVTTIASEDRSDVVHCLYVDRNEVAVWRGLARGHTKPWAAFGTLFWPYFSHRPRTGTPLKSLYHQVNRWTLAHMLRHGQLSSLFVHSAGIRDVLLRRMRGVPPARILEVPDPSEPPIPISQDEARRRLGLAPGATIALFFGTLRPDKGPDIFLKALAKAPADVVGVIAGSPGSFDVTELERLRLSLPDPGRVVLRAEWISQEDMGAYFAAADVVVLPYRRAFQGTSGILQRAAAYGKSVLATDVGEVGTTVRANQLGLVIEPESEQALASSLQRVTRGAEIAESSAGREYARRSDWRVLADRVRRAYLDELEAS